MWAPVPVPVLVPVPMPMRAAAAAEPAAWQPEQKLNLWPLPVPRQSTSALVLPQNTALVLP